jgi:hypothetical protein
MHRFGFGGHRLGVQRRVAQRAQALAGPADGQLAPQHPLRSANDGDGRARLVVLDEAVHEVVNGRIQRLHKHLNRTAAGQTDVPGGFVGHAEVEQLGVVGLQSGRAFLHHRTLPRSRR